MLLLINYLVYFVECCKYFIHIGPSGIPAKVTPWVHIMNPSTYPYPLGGWVFCGYGYGYVANTRGYTPAIA